MYKYIFRKIWKKKHEEIWNTNTKVKRNTKYKKEIYKRKSIKKKKHIRKMKEKYEKKRKKKQTPNKKIYQKNMNENTMKEQAT